MLKRETYQGGRVDDEFHLYTTETRRGRVTERLRKVGEVRVAGTGTDPNRKGKDPITVP